MSEMPRYRDIERGDIPDGKKVYKYLLLEDYEIDTAIKPENNVNVSNYIYLTTAGKLSICRGYAWDGPSGAPDCSFLMRGSLVHDALYQLMRERSKQFCHRRYRKDADILMKEMCREDGMWKWAAWLMYRVLRVVGRRWAKLPDCGECCRCR